MNQPPPTLNLSVYNTSNIIGILVEQLEALKVENNNLKIDLGRLKHYQDENSILHENNKNLEEKNLNLQEHINKLELENIELKKQIEILNNRLNKKDEELIEIKKELAENKKESRENKIKFENTEYKLNCMINRQKSLKILFYMQDINSIYKLEQNDKISYNLRNILSTKVRKFRNNESHLIQTTDDEITKNTKMKTLLNVLENMDNDIKKYIVNLSNDILIDEFILYLKSDLATKTIIDEDIKIYMEIFNF